NLLSKILASDLTITPFPAYRSLWFNYLKIAVTLAKAKVVLEDLNISGLVRNHKLAKSITDASWYNFRQWLEYFGEKYVREIIAVPPHFTSQECSNCGARVQKSLSTRTHSCSHCGHIEQHDVNAAKVILT
ncbi:RNA-guided endonuclease InsQ/TnpB family protein, partial [Nostoc sp.]